MVPSTIVIPEALAEAVRREAAATPGLDLLLVFGSVARGASKPESDVDVAVVGDVDRFELGGRLSLATGREVDVILVDRAPIPLLDAIVREGVAVYEANRGAEARFRARALAMLETDRPWYERMQKAWIERVARRGILGQS